jgi:hypothetical protein
VISGEGPPKTRLLYLWRRGRRQPQAATPRMATALWWRPGGERGECGECGERGERGAAVRPEPSAAHCAAVPAAGGLELRSVLRNGGPACGPNGCLAVTLKGEYLEFLRGEQCEELLLFWDAADKYASVRGRAARAQLSTIVSTYIETGSECELNLDSELRSRVLSVVSALPALPAAGAAGATGAAGEATPDPPAELLTAAQAEVEQLMAGDSFPRFIEVVAKTNITPRVASNRLALNAAVLVAALVVVALLMEAGVTRRAYRVPSILAGTYALGYVVSAKYRI